MNKLDDEEEKLFCITGNENETELQGFNGELYFMRETEDGCIIIGWLDGDNHVFSFYKNGEQIGEISGPNIYEGTHYIADSTFVYSDDKEGGSFLDITTHVVHLSPKGVKMVNEFPGGSFFCFKKPFTEYLEHYYVY